MSAADELRRMLGERGIHWWAGDDDCKTLWESNGLTWEYSNNENGDAWIGFLCACEQDITPEQAIAATLGGGTLTAEQVRDALILYMPHREYYSVEQTDAWQAIADELNPRVERTCKLEPLKAFYVTLNMLDQTEWGVCSNCGTASPIDATYCCECGAKVVSE